MTPISGPDLAQHSGLDLMQGMFAGRFPRAPIGTLMAMDGGSAGEGRVEFIGHPDARHYNPIGTVHGGYAATCSTVAWAAPSTQPSPPGSAIRRSTSTSPICAP